MTVEEVMTRQVATCLPETDLASVARLMREHSCSVVPVLTETRKLAGLLTVFDVCIALVTKGIRASRLAARDVLETERLVCTGPSETMASAIEIMNEENLRYLPVVNESGEFQGIVWIENVIRRPRQNEGEFLEPPRRWQVLAPDPTIETADERH
jgi:CBS domain-containing protein